MRKKTTWNDARKSSRVTSPLSAGPVMDPRDALEEASVRAFFARRAPGRAEPAAAAAWAAAALGFLRRELRVPYARLADKPC